MPASLPARRTPGVYITEFSAFPPSVVGIQTAVPAFIGFTEKAEISGKPVFFKPIPIGSLADFEAVFGRGPKPIYEIKTATDDEIKNNTYDFKVLQPPTPPGTPHHYVLTQKTTSRFNLYNSLRLFYANGGANGFVVSAGSYADYSVASAKQALIDGLNAVREQVGPTMLAVPDAVLLPADPAPAGPPNLPAIIKEGIGRILAKTEFPKSSDFKAVVEHMLNQCGELKDRVAVLDVYGTDQLTAGKTDHKLLFEALIKQFREDVAGVLPEFLSYGLAYFPFLDTTVVPLSDFDYSNFDTVEELQKILGWENANLYNGGQMPAEGQTGTAQYEAVKANIDAMTDPVAAKTTPNTINQNLVAALPLFKEMLQLVVNKNDVLPPSGAMAGIITRIDASRGVWNAPANVSLSSVFRTTYKLNDAMQGDLNVPIDGKAIDALREFTGRGIVVWGARTLDGNSNDYRYIQVRRTLIYIEQSIKNTLNQFVFAANDGNTWVTVVSTVSNFLQGVWSQGGLMGAKASDAFSVQCGLGSTMTGLDILEGRMIVQVTLQMIRPAEFIELTFTQKMEGVA